ncbi:hypothetical protein FRC12_017442 [Ceratobasidium sp. 428]|nr:hypothetical protein FRC12_017442 [Ceratobasidium sp. 428]
MRTILSYLFGLVKRTLSRLNARPDSRTPQSKPKPAMPPTPTENTPAEVLLWPSPSSPASHRLPPELLLYIITTASATASTAESKPLDASSSYPRVRPKPEFASLSGLSGSCRMYHKAVQKAWYNVLVIREKHDWKIAEELKIASYVRSPNSENMTCTFWNMFPNDHDSYFANEGIENYAASLARELKQLDKLQSLHMGLYLTPHEAIMTHIRDHHHSKCEGDSPWDMPCVTCSDQFGNQTFGAEMKANQILFGELPHLQNMSWASFFTSSRLDAVCYTKNSETHASR